MLELKGVTKWSGSLAANDRISLPVGKGTVHAIIGENGAGKSALTNVIGGLYRLNEGELFIHGKKVGFKNPNGVNRAGIGMVHQELMLFPELTVPDNIMTEYEKKKWGIFLNREVVRCHVEDIRREYRFNIPSDELVQNLSVSVLQQIEIVRMSYRGADIIIFDRPASVLTPQGVQGLFGAIRSLVKNSKTVLFVTHKLKEVMETSDHITVLKNKHCVDTAKPDETDEHGLATMTVGREVIPIAQREEKKQGGVLFQVRHLSAPDCEGKEKLRDVSSGIHRGEILGVAGVAGSGQQELMGGLFGLRSNSRGGVLFGGKDITGLSCREHRMCHIGYAPQDRISEGTNREATPWENTIMGYHIVEGSGNRYLLKQEQAMSFAEHITHSFSVKASSPNLKIQTPSGGNIRRLIVDKEFLQDNRLLITEDPTRGVDIGAIEFTQKKIESLAGAEATILLVSHGLSKVMEVSDHILVMYDGQLYDEGIHGEKTETEIGLLMTGGGYTRVK